MLSLLNLYHVYFIVIVSLYTVDIGVQIYIIITIITSD